MAVHPSKPSGTLAVTQPKGSDVEAAKGVAIDQLSDLELVENAEDVADSFGMFRNAVSSAVIFYVVYYAVAAVLSGALGTRFSGLEPFEHEDFTPAVERDDLRPLVVWLSMVLTFCLFGPWIVYFVTRDSDKAVDCATTVQGLHIFLTTT